MGLNNLVGGRGFTVGRFKSNYGSVSASSSGLRKFKDPILKVLTAKQSAIQYGNFKSAEALRHLQRNLGDKEKLSFKDKLDISRVFKQLENKSNTTIEKISRKEIVDRALKAEAPAVKPVANDRPEKKEIKVRIEKATQENNEENIKDSRIAAAQARLSGSTGLAGGKPEPPKGVTPPPAPGQIKHERINL